MNAATCDVLDPVHPRLNKRLLQRSTSDRVLPKLTTSPPNNGSNITGICVSNASAGSHAHEPVTECGCDNLTIIGKAGLRAYWEVRLRDHPALELDDVMLSDGGTTISYLTRDGVVAAVLKFDAAGKIASVRCDPLARTG